MSTATAPAVACPNCDASAPGHFCSACGESQPGHHDLSLKHFVHEAADELAHVDSKIPATLTSLLFRPGFLSEEYFAGRKTRYLLPLRLFLILFTLNFFLYSSFKGVAVYNFARIVDKDQAGTLKALMTKQAAKRNITLQELEDRINHRWLKLINILEISTAFIMALVAAAFFRRSRQFFVEHLIFSLHYNSFALAVSTLVFPIYYFAHIDPLSRGISFAAPQFAVWFFYMWKAVQRFYRHEPLPAAGKALVLLGGNFIGNVFVITISMIIAMVTVLRAT
jgi:hypothetical protein